MFFLLPTYSSMEICRSFEGGGDSLVRFLLSCSGGGFLPGVCETSL